MSRRIHLLGLMVLLACACDAHMPAYDLAMWRAQRKLGSLCASHSKPTLWATGENGYLVTAKKCNRLPSRPGGPIARGPSESLTYLCNNQGCKLLAEAGDWTERARTAPVKDDELFSLRPAAAKTTKQPAATGTADDALEAEIRAQIDARAAAILACTNGAPAVVQVELQPGRTTISLTGKLAGTPAEACVRAALAELKPSKERTEPHTVQHSVVPE